MIQSAAARFSTAFQLAAGGNLLILREPRCFCVHRLAITSTAISLRSTVAGSRGRLQEPGSNKHGVADGLGSPSLQTP